MIIRIDDYPSGIRPIMPEQLDMFEKMFDEFERHGILIHLGIVPLTYLNYGRKLKNKNIIPCQHGYEHDYKLKSAECLKNGDPYNNRTFIAPFDEFDMTSDHKIIDRIKTGKVIIERDLGPVNTYIPVCNVINAKLLRALEESGFKQILCENVIASSIPILQSGYYGTLDNYDFRLHPVITLHITWEWDTVREKGFKYWAGLVEKLSVIAEKVPVKVININSDKPYRILWKFPIRYRREKFFQTLDQYYNLIIDKKNSDWLVTIDADDPELNNPEVLQKLSKYRGLSYAVAECKSKIEAVNHGIGFKGDGEPRTWDIVVIVSDDMIPKVKGLDDIIRRRMAEYFPDTDGALWFNDGFQADKINTIQIMGRKWFDRWGYVYHEDYVSQRCDVEYQLVAKKFNRIRYFPDVLIRHEHADFGLVPYDKLLLHNYTFIRRDEEVFKAREKLGFPVKIPKITHFIWSKGVKLTYLRYLAYKTFKDLHPDWQIMFHLVEGCSNEKTWEGKEELEFMTNTGTDYLKKVAKTDLIYDKVDRILPNYASDLLRWQSLYVFGGFYFDLDQIFVKSFNTLTDYDIVWGGDKINYSGVVGMFKRCPIALEMYNRVGEKLKEGPKSYCEAGNWLWDKYITANPIQFYQAYRTPMRYFYPIEQSFMMQEYYLGKVLDLSDSYAVHWFGGHPDSQKFNRLPEFEIDKIISKWNL